jgi:hypothetical protein
LIQEGIQIRDAVPADTEQMTGIWLKGLELQKGYDRIPAEVDVMSAFRERITAPRAHRESGSRCMVRKSSVGRGYWTSGLLKSLEPVCRPRTYGSNGLARRWAERFSYGRWIMPKNSA